MSHPVPSASIRVIVVASIVVVLLVASFFIAALAGQFSLHGGPEDPFWRGVMVAVPAAVVVLLVALVAAIRQMIRDPGARSTSRWAIIGAGLCVALPFLSILALAALELAL